MNFLIIGAGGVGGFFGASLYASGERVQFLARGKHFNAIQNSGLTVTSPGATITIPASYFTNNPDDLLPADVVLFCVKSYDTETAAQQIASIVRANTILISLQNGLENELAIQRVLGKGNVFGGVAYVSAAISSRGVITETGGPRKIVFGPLNGKIEQRSEDILASFKQASIQAELSQQIETELWRKFVFITAVGGLTAMTRLNLGELISTLESRQLLHDAMNETTAVARAKGVQLPANLTEHFMETISRFNPNTYSSLHHDLTHEKPLEIDALSGTVVRLGKELGILTPIHQTIYASLLPFHQRFTRMRNLR